MAAYYNELDPYCAAWLRNLIAAGHIAPGDVDTRSIVDVRADDLKGYQQCHWFAGIGGWSLALRLAGIPDDRPVWTGSCPCQPFSAAGKGEAADDERHLWPAWFPLIAECRPARVYGEQVEAAIGWGWLDLVFADLEAEGYACGAAVLPACGVGAPHIRQRCYFVADSDGGNASAEGIQRGGKHGLESKDGRTDRLADLAQIGRRQGNQDTGGIGEGTRAQRERSRSADDGIARNLGDAIQPRLEGHARHGAGGVRHKRQVQEPNRPTGAAGLSDFWSDVIWLPCRDGKARPTKPGIFPLATGIRARVGKLRAAGNAIVPQVAEAFIRACDARIQ